MNSFATARAWAEVDLAALRHNLAVAKATGKKVMCVIKADAYGHGAVRCGLHLQQHGADSFAVACLSEALELRRAGVSLPMLVLGYTPHEYAAVLAKQGLTQTAVDESAAVELSAAAVAAGVTVDVHIKVDTGMSRAGLFAQGKGAAQEAAAAAERIMALPGLNVTGMYTHFSVAGTPGEDAYTAWQLENYRQVIGALDGRGKRPAVCHASNSACILAHPEAQIDMVREGIMLYGLYPDSVPSQSPLKPVLTLKSRVSQVKRLPKGSSISYGRTFEAQEDMDCAVITAGYADGYPRSLSNRSWVLINGQRCRQVGRVCMDMIMADVTGKNVKRGDEVVLFGAPDIGLEEIAKKAGTISYELASLVTRVHRVYINE